jgi:hypothetical protein
MSTLSRDINFEAGPTAITTVALAHAHVDWFSSKFTYNKLISSGYQVKLFTADYFTDAEAFEQEAEEVTSGIGALVVSRFHPHLNPEHDMQDRIAIASAAGKQIFQMYDSLSPYRLNAWPVRTAKGIYVGDVMAGVDLREVENLQKLDVWAIPREVTASGRTFDESIRYEEDKRQLIDEYLREGV